MPKLFQTVVRRVTVQGGGDIPAGAAVMSDSLVMAAVAEIADSNASQTDAAFFAITDAESETIAAQVEALTVSASGSGLSEAVDGQSESVASTLVRWATSNTTAGTAPTNPANAEGSNDGTVAQVKAGGITNGTSTLTLTIAAPLTGVTAGASVQIRAYYAITAGVTETFTVQIRYRQVGFGADTVVALPVTGNYLANGTSWTVGNVDPAFPVTATFTHTAVTPAAGGNIQVDAVGVQSTGVL